MWKRFLYFWASLASAIALASFDSQRENFQSSLILKAEQQVKQVLERYCKDACELLQVESDIDEDFQGIEDLGFEGLDETNKPVVTFRAKKLRVKVQIDTRVDTKNRGRLSTILQNQLMNLSSVVEVSWAELAIPEIGQENTTKARILRSLEDKFARIANDIFDKYCPETCLMSGVKANGQIITQEQAEQLDPKDTYFDRKENAWLKVNEAMIEVTISLSMAEEERRQVGDLIRNRISFLNEAKLDLQTTKFPETYNSRRERLEKESTDPYGLEKLKKTLSIFKEMSADRDEIGQAELSDGANISKWIIAAVVLLIVAGLVFLVVARYGAVQREAMMMRQAAEFQRQRVFEDRGRAEEHPEIESPKSKKTELDESVMWRIKADALKDEIFDIITRNPKVAREIFGRLIIEEGVEETSKYIHVLGNSAIFDLLNDPAHRRSLRDLSEYYQKASFDFGPEEETRILSGLKTKVLASELRVMTRKELDAFDFLTQLDGPQVFNLIMDEKPRIQSAVLGQLSTSRRRQVFELFKGEARVALMNELCDQGNITKDYLMNVARALNRKVSGRGGLDPESTRSSDMIQELLERAGLDEQRNLVRNLEITNPDGARNIKMRLITLHTLGFLKSGTLVEIILDMEHSDLVLFLAGAPENIAKLIIEQAPSELADSLIEDIETVSIVDESNFRLVELKVLSKIRSMAGSGRLNLFEINEAMFAPRQATDSKAKSAEGKLSAA